MIYFSMPLAKERVWFIHFWVGVRFARNRVDSTLTEYYFRFCHTAFKFSRMDIFSIHFIFFLLSSSNSSSEWDLPAFRGSYSNIWYFRGEKKNFQEIKILQIRDLIKSVFSLGKRPLIDHLQTEYITNVIYWKNSTHFI